MSLKDWGDADHWLGDREEKLWQIYEAIYGHRSAHGIDPFETAVRAVQVLVKQRDKLIADANESNRILGDECARQMDIVEKLLRKMAEERVKLSVPPREPTQKMMDAGTLVYMLIENNYIPKWEQSIAARFWRAMYDAAMGEK